MYRLGTREKSKRRKIIFWTIVIIILLLLLLLGGIWLRAKLRPKASISQAKPFLSSVSYASQTKHYDEPDFGIDIPISWQPVARPPGTYQSYTWQTSDSGTNGEQIEIFEDTIPVNFAVNRALIVEASVDHLTIDGTASDNCSKFTRGTVAAANQFGVPAKWMGVNFLCDQSNQERDTIGTSSTDGVNVVIFKSQSTGVSHKFLFSYTDHQTNPDYTIFYNALNSFRMN